VPINVADPNDFKRNKMPLNRKNCEPGEIISMDPSGLIPPKAAKGEPLFYLFKDEFNHAVCGKDQPEASGTLCIGESRSY
jgi:hypothetical protein